MGGDVLKWGGEGGKLCFFSVSFYVGSSEVSTIYS